MWVVPGSPLQCHAERSASIDRQITVKPGVPPTGRSPATSIYPYHRSASSAVTTPARVTLRYHYVIHPRDEKSDTIQRPGTIYLARCDRAELMDRGAYEFFTGVQREKAIWTKDVSRKTAVFEDHANGTGWVLSVSYNAGLRRYLLMTDHTVANRGNLGIFDAPEPWRPWTTVLYLDEAEGTYFGSTHVEPNSFSGICPPSGRVIWNLRLSLQDRVAAGITIASTWSGDGLNCEI
jgi:hypothetical protein